MKKLLIPFIFLLAFTTYSIDSKAQCNNQLVNNCALNVGDNATYIKDFKAKLKKARRGASAPIAMFTIVLNKGTHYRFTVCNAKEFEGEAVLQLYDTNNMLGSTFDLARGKDYKAFDLMCRKTATYKVYMTFQGGKEGCAVGILSIVR